MSDTHERFFYASIHVWRVSYISYDKSYPIHYSIHWIKLCIFEVHSIYFDIVAMQNSQHNKAIFFVSL